MDTFPFEYKQIEPATWAYLSSLLLIALFFKFNRFWSVRNLDIFLIILLAPGLLLIQSGKNWVRWQQEQESIDRQIKAIDEAYKLKKIGGDPQVEDLSQPGRQSSNDSEVVASEKPTSSENPERLISERANELLPGHIRQRWGYCWLFGVGAILLIRMLIDPSLTKRPLLEPNLSIGGLVFFGVSLMTFLLANIATSVPNQDDLQGAKNAVKLLQRERAKPGDMNQLRRRGPGYRLFNLLPIIPSFESQNEILKTDPEQENGTNLSRYVIAAKSLAITSQLFIVIGLILFCRDIYGNFYAGIGVSTIYLMLPYTAMFTGHVLHALPAALLVWALLMYRRPAISGTLMGLATGVSYYPIFLLPLWASFYWERGVKRFSLSYSISIVVCVFGLAFSSVDIQDFLIQIRAMFGFWQPLMNGLEGIWELGWNQWWRLPILVTFVLFCISFVFWPTEKNIGTLISYTAAVMIAVQFWHGFGGGLYIAWYFPMVLLTFFRPNLIGRVATQELRERNRVRKEKPEDLLPAT